MDLTLLLIIFRDKVQHYFQTSQSSIDLSSERDFDFLFYFVDGDHSWGEVHWLVSTFYKVSPIIRVFSVASGRYFIRNTFQNSFKTRKCQDNSLLFCFRQESCFWNDGTKLNQIRTFISVVVWCQSNLNKFVINTTFTVCFPSY